MAQKDIEEALFLYKYISATDVFMTFYNRRMLKRIILNQSHDDDMEFNVVGQIKDLAGEEKTEKTELLVKNLKQGSEIQKRFESHLSSIDYSKVKPEYIKIVLIE